MSLKQSALDGMMADLRRTRLDEFWLSNESRRGPTFTPSLRNQAEHVPPEQKAELQAGWSTFVDDEESEQMKGLTDADARPWAQQIAKQVLDKSPAAGEPSRRPVQPSRPKRRDPPDIFLAPVNGSRWSTTNSKGQSTGNNGQTPNTKHAAATRIEKPPSMTKARQHPARGTASGKVSAASPNLNSAMPKSVQSPQDGLERLQQPPKLQSVPINPAFDLLSGESTSNTMVEFDDVFNGGVDGLVEFRCPTAPSSVPGVVGSAASEYGQVLIDFEPEPDAANIVEQILGLLSFVLPSIAEQGIVLNDAVLDGVQKTVIAEWMGRAESHHMRQSVSSDEWDDIMDVVRATIKLKIKAARKRKQGPQRDELPKSSALQELQQEFAVAEQQPKVPAKRRQYTPEQLENMIPAKDHPDYQANPKWESLRSGMVGVEYHQTSAANLAVPVTGQPATATEHVQVPSSSGVLLGVHTEPTRVECPPAPSTPRKIPQQKGLASSRWAPRTPHAVQAAQDFAALASGAGIRVERQAGGSTPTAATWTATLTRGLKSSRWAD